MPVIEWVEALSVHVDELDEQHRRIVEVINDLHDALLHSKITELDIARTKALDVMEGWSKAWRTRSCRRGRSISRDSHA